MSIREIFLSSPIEEKIVWAETSYQAFKEHFLKDKAVLDGLEGVKKAIYVSRREMGKIGIAGICTECEEQEGGSCCGAGLENRFDGWLLLVNLLLDQKLPRTRRDEKSCFFLGEAGCLLYARHVICINYLCKKITRRVDPKKINSLQEKEGQEVHHLFLLNERVKRVLKAHMGEPDRLSDNGKCTAQDLGQGCRIL
jgi:hypothetical protein